jgi:cell division protein FtsZ
MIESGPPQLQGATPPPLPQSYAAAYEQGAFAPQPPSEVRRQASRPMMPEDDYPESGQSHAYRAPDESYADGMAHHHPAHPQRHPQQAEPRRRIGLFERITGRVRGATDSDTGQRDSHGAYAGNAHGGSSPGNSRESYENYAHAVNPHEHQEQTSEIPVFFREKRR